MWETWVAFFSTTWASLVTEYALMAMFMSAFFSATILPGNSEMVFLALLVSPIENKVYEPIVQLFAVAVIGNSLGSFTTYWMGRLLPRTQQHQRQHPRFVKSISLLQRYGVYTLFLSWLPVIGDLLCGVAGWLRLHAMWSWLFILLGKAVRYAFLLLLAMNIF